MHLLAGVECVGSCAPLRELSVGAIGCQFWPHPTPDFFSPSIEEAAGRPEGHRQKVMARRRSGGRPPRSYDHVSILVEKIHLSDGDDAGKRTKTTSQQQEFEGSDVMAVDEESDSSLEVVSKPGTSPNKTLFGTPAQADESIVSTSTNDPETMLVPDAGSTPHEDSSDDFDALLEDAESTPQVDPKAYRRYSKNEQKAKKVKKEKNAVLKKPSRSDWTMTRQWIPYA